MTHVTTKRNNIIGTAVLLALLMTAASALAATVSFVPASIEAKNGGHFNAGISVDAQGAKTYTVKIEINYPADALEVESFSFGSGWTALVQPGYDVIDNVHGKLIKTAGYPGGLSSQASFGTIVFKAKKNGHQALRMTTNSLALDAANHNTMTGLPVESSVLITPVAPPLEKPNKPQTPNPALSPESKQALKPSPSASPLVSPAGQTVEPTVSPAQALQTAQAISSLASTRNVLLLAAVIGIAVLIGWIMVKRK